MAPGAGKSFVCRLNEVGITMAGQALLGSRGRLRGSGKSTRNKYQTTPGKEKVCCHLCAAYVPDSQAYKRLATHVPEQSARLQRLRIGGLSSQSPASTQVAPASVLYRYGAMVISCGTSCSCPTNLWRTQPSRYGMYRMPCLHCRPSWRDPERCRSWS